MLNFKEFIESKNLTDRQREELIDDYEMLTIHGQIGSCALRTLANEWADYLGCSISVTSTMNSIAFDCYIYFTHKYLENKYQS